MKRASSLKTKPEFLTYFFIVLHFKYNSMNAETLLKILEKTPGDYEVKYRDSYLKGTVEIDTENRKIILK